jgi:hypothetical protein
MSYRRDFVDTMPTEPARLASTLYSSTVRRTDRWVNRLLNLLVAVAIGAGLAWWLWEWAVACTTALTCGLAQVRPQPTTSHAAATNEERLHAAISAAHKAGHDAGYCAGFKAGARYGRVLQVGAGVVLGAALVAGMLQLGLAAGAGA